MDRSAGVFSIVLFFSTGVWAQQVAPDPSQMMMIKPKGHIVCYASGESHPVYLPSPAMSHSSSARTQITDIKVDYVGFPPAAEAAFQRAVDIWKGLIQSPVRINIRAAWVAQSANTLGSAIWGNAFANFDGAPKLGVYYPVALAEKLAGKPLNPDPNPKTGDNYDIYAFFNSSQSKWSFTDTPTDNIGKYNLTTVVLHEIGHGLGFTDTYSVANNLGGFGLQSSSVPMVFDIGVENGATNANTRLLNQINNTADFAALLTNENINYNPALSLGGVAGMRAKLYAPTPWQAGSSIAHLDQTTYSGTSDMLMRPQLDLEQITLTPGTIVLNAFADMGWVSPSINHTQLKDTEVTNSPFIVTANITSDGTSGYSVNSTVKIRYQINGGSEVEATMTAGTGSQYTYQLPQPVIVPTTYNYFILTADSYNGQNRTFNKPGQLIRPGQSDQQVSFQFLAGPDLIPPVITTTPLDYIFTSVTAINLKATVTDNIGVQSVKVSYQKNAGSFQDIGMVQDNDSLTLYKATIPTSGVVIGDVINYKIIATDGASSPNQVTAPSTGQYSVAVTGVLPSQNDYQNNFNTVNSDFFGNGYSIATPAGFSNGAIHSLHPYSDGTGANNESNYVYQLRVPIKINGENPTITFDEIVLVEPSETSTTVFGSANFWDYVIIEGSIDNGVTWKRFLDGYDSRANSDWLAKWNSAITAQNSTAVADASLYRSRSFDMTSNGNFKANDIVQIRFRLFADQAAHGWGWAIDNLKIQVDQNPPTVLHNHLDYSIGTTKKLQITTNVTDPSGVKSLAIEYKTNNGAVASLPFAIDNAISSYTLELDISALKVGDVFQYRILSSDNLDNSGTVPVSGFFQVPVINVGSPVSQYTSDFNSANTDFVGNFFSVATSAGLSNGAINSSHPYSNGFGLNNTSSYSYTLTKPVTVSASNPNIIFSEILIAEYTGTTVKDFAIVEASKDNGLTWEALVDKYSGNAFPEWKSAFDIQQNGNSSIYKMRLFDMTTTGKFKAGDVILIRFRLAADAINNGWGWAIDNLSIQGPVTGLEKPLIENSFSVYPNPTGGSKVMVRFNAIDDSPVEVQFLNARGDVQHNATLQPVSNKVEHEFFVGDWSNGLYIIKAEVGGSVITKKFIKTQ